MAENKKKVVVYTDWLKNFEDLTDEELGKLMRHFFMYINDMNPILEDRLLKIAWNPIETTLKRDLKKWEDFVEKQKENGAKGGRPKESQKTQAFKNIPKKADSDSDSVSVNDSVIDNVNESNYKINKSLLSEIKISDLEDEEIIYFEIAKAYQQLFIKNLKEKNAPAAAQENAKYKAYVDPIRLMMTKDEVTKEQLTKVFKYLGSPQGEFWKSNILSTTKLREKFTQLLLKSKENGKQSELTNEEIGQRAYHSDIARHYQPK